MKELADVNQLFRALETVLKSADAGLDAYNMAAEERRYIKEFNEAVGIPANRISPETVQLYSTEGLAYGSAVSVLRKNNIPCTSFIDNKSGTVLIAVPKELRNKSDIILDELNHTAIRNEQSRASFMRTHLGLECTEFTGITKDMQFFIRDAMMDRAVNFCFEKTNTGDYKLYCGKKDAGELSSIVFQARTCTEGKAGKLFKYIIERQNEAIRDAEFESGNNRENAVFITDAENGGLYRIKDGLFERITAGGLSEIIADSGKDGAGEFKAHIRAVISDMTLPVTAVKQNPNIKDLSIDGLFNKQQIAASRADLAKIAAENGRMGKAQEYAAQIAYMYCYGNGFNRMEVDRLNRSLGFAQFLTAECKDVAINTVVKKLENLRLTEKEATEILGYVKNIVHSHEGCSSTHEINVSNLDFGDMHNWMGREASMEITPEFARTNPERV